MNMLRLKVHEGKVRQAKIDVETAVLLAKSASLEKELMTCSNLKGGKYTPPPGFGPNFVDARPPMYFPSSNLDPTQNQPSTPVHNPSRIDLTTQNPQYASVSYQTPSSIQNNPTQMPPHPQNTQTAPRSRVKIKIKPPSTSKHRIPI